MSRSVSLSKKEVLVFILIILSLSGIFYKPIFSSDIWLHLKMGEYIVQNDYTLPISDPFSYTTKGKPVILCEWLSQIVLYLVYNEFGFTGLRVMRVLLMMAALSFVFWTAFQISNRFLVALLVLLVTAYLFRTRYLIRPELFSILFFTFVYTWFTRTRKRFKHVDYAIFFLLCVLWINLHPFMLFAGVIVAILSFARMVTKVRGITSWFRITELPFNPNVLFLLFLIGSIINPYGYHIYGYVFGATPVVKQYIQEWQPIFICLQRRLFRFITGGVLAFPCIMKGLVSGIIACFLTVLIGSYTRRIRWSIGDILIGLLTIYLAITAARFAWLLFVPVLLIVKYGTIYVENRGLPERPRVTTFISFIMVGAGVIIACLYWMNECYTRIPYNLKHEIQIENYPDVPVRILKATNLSGRLYNPSGWGGYLIYHLYPRYKVFVDTRTYLHGETILVNSMLIQYQYPGFERLLETYGFDILLFKKMFGDRRPFYSADWILIFENVNSAMYVKKNKRNKTNLKKIVKYYKENNVPFDPKKGFDLEELRKDDHLSELYRLR